NQSGNRFLWLIAGLAVGLGISWFWPQEPMHAGTSDRDEKFAMLTVPVKDVQFAGVRDHLEAVFVLDFLTGQLKGAVLGKTGKFTHFYFRNVAADFQVNPAATPHYAFVQGTAQLPSTRQNTMATGVIYVGELSSGKIGAYGFTYNDTNRPVGPIALAPMHTFAFREAGN
ncbi:MAG: hypothetical protein KDA84_08425, partial [Planctomycetaceae bacterium]|nr:hypothetical protein [Planctomycetaceae bacterium]